jgi:hypothetical protein
VTTTVVQQVQDFFAKFASEAEADVLRVVTALKHGIAVIETDLVKADAWITSNLPQVITFLASVESTLAILTGAGIPVPAATAAIVAEALKYGVDASNALAAYNSDLAAGKSQTQALADAYAAFVTAKAAGAEAAAALIAVPAKS